MWAICKCSLAMYLHHGRFSCEISCCNKSNHFLPFVLGGATACSQYSLRRRRKLSQSSIRSQSMSTNNSNKELPEILSQHVIVSETVRNTTPTPPDVLADSQLLPSAEPDVMSRSQSSFRSLTHRQVVTLDSRPRSRSNRFNRSPAGDSNPYDTQPRASSRRYSTSGRPADHRHSLLYSSLTRNLSTASGEVSASIQPVERAGPPPDIAAQPPRRLTGTSTPPDVTSSPNNTWQAML